MQTMEIAVHDKGLRLFWPVGLNGKRGTGVALAAQAAPGTRKTPASDLGTRGQGLGETREQGKSEPSAPAPVSGC